MLSMLRDQKTFSTDLAQGLLLEVRGNPTVLAVFPLSDGQTPATDLLSSEGR